MRAIGMICVFWSFTCLLFAQERLTKEIHVSVDAKLGVVLPEYQYVNSITHSNIQQFEISVYQQCIGRDFWQQLYKYPKIGLSFYYSTLGNKDVLGNEFALFPYFSLTPIVRNRFLLENQLGLGLGYATKKFDLQTNYTNIAVGSRLNVHLSYKLGAIFKVTKAIQFNCGIAFNHFSNANMKEPNLGINTLSMYGGLSALVNKEQEKITSEIPVFNKGHEFAFIYAAGGKHTRALSQTIFFTSSFSVEYKRKIKRRFQFGCGVDLFYDSSTEKEMNVPGKIAYKSQYDFRSGIHLSQEFIYNRFSFTLQEGFYVGLLDRVDNSFMYNRAMIRYKFNAHFFINASMKSHLHILDYPELGFAYYFVK